MRHLLRAINALSVAAWFVIISDRREKERERFQSKLLRRSETCVEIRLPFDFRSTATFVSFRFLCTEFLCSRESFLSLAPHAHRHVCLLPVETLLSWDLPEVEARSTTSQSKCLCQTSGCLCCVDLNLTAAIDIGGPVCINLRQKEQNVSLNLSYRDNPVHNATIRIGK